MDDYVVVARAQNEAEASFIQSLLQVAREVLLQTEQEES
jgi:hypothetical protein